MTNGVILAQFFLEVMYIWTQLLQVGVFVFKFLNKNFEMLMARKPHDIQNQNSTSLSRIEVNWYEIDDM